MGRSAPFASSASDLVRVVRPRDACLSPRARPSSGVTNDHPIRVIAAVIARGDALLVCQRPPHKRHGGLWEFPGGKCEPGESDEDTARRELREELGVEVLGTDAEEFAIEDPGSPFHIAFVPTRIAGDPACHEHTALRWASLAELATMALAPSDRRYVEFLASRAA